MNALLQQGVISEITDTQNIQYILNDNSVFSLTEYKVLKSQSKHFIKCAKVLYNGKIKLVYFTAMNKSLKNILRTLDIDTFLTIIANLLNCVIDIKNNGFLDCNGLDLSYDKIFVDQNTFEVNVIYLPVNCRNSDSVAFENEFRTEIIKLITSIPAFSSEKARRVCGYFSNGMFSLNQVYESVCLEIKGDRRRSSYQEEKYERRILSSKQPTLYLSSVNSPVNICFEINTDEYIIGKNPVKVNGVINFNEAISRVHCKINYQNNTYFITDLGSANGTYLNNSRIAPNQAQIIRNGDSIRIANSNFVVRF